MLFTVTDSKRKYDKISKRLSYHEGTARRAMLVEILSIPALLHNCTKNSIGKSLQ